GSDVYVNEPSALTETVPRDGCVTLLASTVIGAGPSASVSLTIRPFAAAIVNDWPAWFTRYGPSLFATGAALIAMVTVAVFDTNPAPSCAWYVKVSLPVTRAAEV